MKWPFKRRKTLKQQASEKAQETTLIMDRTLGALDATLAGMRAAKESAQRLAASVQRLGRQMEPGKT